MDYKEAKDKLLAQLEVLETLNDAGLMEMVGHIDEDKIFLKNDVDIDSTRRIINKLFGCNSDNLHQYHMSHCGNYLATGYKNDIVTSYYYSSKTEDLLQKVSKGKCKVVEMVEPEKTVKRVVCEMEEES